MITIRNKILIVDDDADILELLGSYLSKENYQIDYAHNGKQGLEKLKDNEYHTVLLDVMMPEMDGYTLLEKLREFSEVPVILLTAKGEQMAKIKGFTRGCDDYVVKPFDLAELSSRIRAVQKRIVKENSASTEAVITVKDIMLSREEKRTVRRNGSANRKFVGKGYLCLE